MKIMPYIHFDGTCAEAMAFYLDVFGGTDMMVMRYSELAADQGGIPGSDRLMHSQFATPQGMLMASDSPPGVQGGPQQSVSVMVAPPTVAASQAVFDRLAAGGAVVMPFGPTFWSPGFGMVTDRFGTSWIIGAEPEGAPA